MNESPIIMFGAPRSGTTYLSAILNTHPDVYVTHETRVFAWAYESLRVLTDQDRLVNTHRSRFVAHLESELPDLIRDFYANMRPHARYWGDKNPHYAARTGELDMIAELYPDPRFIHIVRDGRDVVASLLRKHKSDGRPWTGFEGATRTWVDHVANGREFGARHPEAYLELCYEELISRDTEVAAAVFAFLDIGLHPAVEEFCAAQQRDRTPLSGPTRDLARVAGSDWGSVLSIEEQLAALAVIGDQLVDSGYETRASLDALRNTLALVG